MPGVAFMQENLLPHIFASPAVAAHIAAPG
jgi:hypothetical protein